MAIEETTIVHPRRFTMRFRYFESGHVCKIKVKKENRDRRILCDCKIRGWRETRPWYKPIEWAFRRPLIMYGIDKVINLFRIKGLPLKRRWNYWGGGGLVCRWIRKNITLD